MDLKCKVLLLLNKKGSGKNFTCLQVEQWNENKPSLANRVYYTKDGDVIAGKSKGIGYEAFKIIAKNNKKITKLLKGDK
jgi:hypothetical protein